MAQLEILHFPDPRLRRPAEPVAAIDAALQALIDDMFETMYAAPGIGLAAPQVDVAKHLVVVDISEHHDQPLVLINPEIVARHGEVPSEEGCLSIPGITDTVSRAAAIQVKALDRRGEPFELEAEGLLGVCIQHEVDHLEGRLFIDYLSPLKRQRLRKKFDKRARERER
ncbi:MAG: peptide deformylase [Candidatus Competibacterales bacterium]